MERYFIKWGHLTKAKFHIPTEEKPKYISPRFYKCCNRLAKEGIPKGLKIVHYSMGNSIPFSMVRNMQPIAAVIANFYGVKIYWHYKLLPGDIEPIQTFDLIGYDAAVYKCTDVINYMDLIIERHLFRLSIKNRRKLYNIRRSKNPKRKNRSKTLPTSLAKKKYIRRLEIRLKGIFPESDNNANWTSITQYILSDTNYKLLNTLHPEKFIINHPIN